MRRRLREPTTAIVLAAIAAVFFFTPIVVWIGGVRAKPIENRPFTALPKLSQGWGAFDQLSQWAIDRLPLRSNAITFNTNLSKKVFHELPQIDNSGGPIGVGQSGAVGGSGTAAAPSGGTPRDLQVIPGKDGWLFYGDEFVRACTPEVSATSVVDGLRRLGQILRESGRTFLFAVPPDKHVLSTRYLPDNLPEKACTAKADAQRRALLTQDRLPGYVDVLSALEARQQSDGMPIFQKYDTHWNTTGDLVFTRTMMGALEPALLHDTRFVPGRPVSAPGDLSVISGAPVNTVERPYSVLRRGETQISAQTTDPIANYPIETVRNAVAPGGATLYRPSTLIYGDSFVERTLPMLTPFFADVTRIPELSRAAASGGAPAAAKAQADVIAGIRSHQTLIVEQTERTLWGAAGTIVQPGFLDALAKALGVSP